MSDTVYGIIYRIYNIFNNKSYVGKTKSIYGNSTIYGVEGRWRQHIVNSNIESRKNECPLFYNALRKYGKDSFRHETLVHCPLGQVDFYEIKMINIYCSSNRKFGYNVSEGGGGRSVVNVSENVRGKISKSQSTKDSMNLHDVYRDNILVGYRISRKDKGKNYQKYFSSQSNALDENLRLAQDFLNNLRNDIVSNVPYNRTIDLPTNINYYKDKSTKEILGYKVNKIINGKTYTKTFCRKGMTMEEKFQLAIEYKEDLCKNYQKNSLKKD